MKSETAHNRLSNWRDALILVDLQNDFLPGGPLAVPQGDQVIAIANRIQPLFELVFATRDWHPPRHGSFAASHPNSHPGAVIQLNGLDQVLWPVHCVQQTPGAALAADLAPHPGRQEILKGQDPVLDSYSGFFDNDHRSKTELDALLRDHDVRRVFIMGLATDYCVKFTALDAVRLGYETYLIQDGCRGVDLTDGDVDRAIDSMRAAGVRMIQSDTLSQTLGKTDASNAAAIADSQADVVAETPHLRLLRRGTWDYVARQTGSGVVAIVAVTPTHELVLIEQYRPPLARNVIELPAGIVGDLETEPDESCEKAAGRELLEETGYRARALRSVLTAASSAGLTDEQITFVMARDLERVDEGGGDASESITVHLVPLTELDAWLHQQVDAGRLIDSRVPTGIYLLRANW